MAISWETGVGILFPVLMQILSNFLKKQRKVSMGCRSIPLKFTLNCLKAPVVMVSSPCFSVWEEWENDCLSKITKFQKKTTQNKTVFCVGQTSGLWKIETKKKWVLAQCTQGLAWNTEYSGSKLCSITFVQQKSSICKNMICVGLSSPSSDTLSRSLSWTQHCHGFQCCFLWLWAMLSEGTHKAPL